MASTHAVVVVNAVKAVKTKTNAKKQKEQWNELLQESIWALSCGMDWAPSKRGITPLTLPVSRHPHSRLLRFKRIAITITKYYLTKILKNHTQPLRLPEFWDRVAYGQISAILEGEERLYKRLSTKERAAWTRAEKANAKGAAMKRGLAKEAAESNQDDAAVATDASIVSSSVPGRV
jgi:hypothetical protein